MIMENTGMLKRKFLSLILVAVVLLELVPQVFAVEAKTGAESVAFKTGETLLLDEMNFLYPLDKFPGGNRCVLSAVKKAADNFWCISISSSIPGGGTVPVTYEYYVKVGDVLNFRSMINPTGSVKLKVKLLDWNKVVFEVI